MTALPDGSTREIAKVAGVGNKTVHRAQLAATNVAPDAELARVTGADGKSYPGRIVGTTTVGAPTRALTVTMKGDV